MKRTLQRLHDPTWLVLPDNVAAQIATWRRAEPDLVVDEVRGFTGLTTSAVTITDRSISEQEKQVLFFLQPHGHEPAETAGAMEVLGELITGQRLDGRPTTLDVPALLRRLVVVVNPLGNPDGRSRIPAECMDDSLGYLEATYYWNGKLSGEDRYFRPAVHRFRRSEYDFDPDYPMALRFEQVGADLFSDPWNDPAADLRENPTSLARLAQMILDRHRVGAVVDLHQVPEHDYVQVWVTEFPDSEATAQAHRMAQRVENDWAQADFHVCWRYRYPYGKLVQALHEYGSTRPPLITVEVGAGVGHRNALMHRRIQGEACASAVRSILNFYAGR